MQCWKKWVIFRKYSHILCKYSADKFSTCGKRIAVVGSGPAGFYSAQQLLKAIPNLKIDIFEKLPVPFGLVRSGVAPDHPEVKNVINSFTETAKRKECRFFGNVAIGEDLTVPELQQHYAAVILAYGADDNRTLGIPGENLRNIHSARRFVGWYNGVFDDKDLDIDLSVDTAVVIGHGNVALDVARILLRKYEELETTDITTHAQNILRFSKIRRVYLLGRRGPLQVSFTTAELREMTKLSDVSSHILSRDFEDISNLISDLPRPRRRLSELLLKTATDTLEGDICGRYWALRFYRSPLELLSEDGVSVTRLRLGVNRLIPDGVSFRLEDTTLREEIAAPLVVHSLGYRSIPIDKNVPFDEVKGVVPNDRGRVCGAPGLYCSGWVKRGPVGVIASTMTDAFETAKSIAEDFPTLSAPQGHEDIERLLLQRGVNFVTLDDWLKIDAYEVDNGSKRNKLREKIVDKAEMLRVAHGL